VSTCIAGDGLGARAVPTTEVVVTLSSRPLAAYGRELTSARSHAVTRELAAAQARTERSLLSAIPEAEVRWHYHLVANGFAVVVPKVDVKELSRVPGVVKVWPNLTYHDLTVSGSTTGEGWQVVGADKLWGPTLATAGAGIKIGIIDDGVEAQHPYFDPTGYAYPPGFPKGQTQYTTPKVIVQRTFAPEEPAWKYANVPFDPTQSFHATHVAGIAAGDHNTNDGTELLSGVAPEAYIGNYKALTIPTSDFGLDGNSAEITAAIESAVSDGMNVINLSLGEPEIAPSRDIVVQALDAAAKDGVVPVVAAGNDFDEFGAGSIDSPANAPGAITVAAATKTDQIADFSSSGPTPYSLQLKPDVTAPGVGITSSLPNGQGGPWGELNGTSMASPHVAGGVALLKERHPTWTTPELKSALVQTADPVKGPDGREVSVLREGGGMIDLPRADDPLFFAVPSSVTFPLNGGSRSVALTDAGGGAGTWSVAVQVQGSTPAGVKITAPSTVDVPGALQVTATAATKLNVGSVTGFVVLTNGANTRRIPFWLAISHPQLETEQALPLLKPGTYTGTTAGKPSKVSHYRYPTGGDTPYPGPESVYRIRIAKPVANFGVAVLSGTAVPHVVFAGDENHLVGYPGLPVTLNPYAPGFGDMRPIAGAILPTPGTYEIVFDTRSASSAGPFTFRYWVNDTTPPRIAVASPAKHTLSVTITDAGAGVDPQSVSVVIDGRRSTGHNAKHGALLFTASSGRHTVVVTASDYQETKNMEDVAPIRPNTSTLTRTVVVR
jgi:subtilisin family serine protease